MGNVIFCNQMCSKTHLIFKKCIGGPAWCGCMRGACQLQVVSASVQLNSVVKSWYSNPGPPEYLSAKTIGHLNFLICRKLSFGGKWRYFCLNVESEGQNKWWHSRRKKKSVVACQARNAERERLRNTANETVGLCMYENRTCELLNVKTTHCKQSWHIALLQASGAK
jgi:hypothetical protein